MVGKWVRGLIVVIFTLAASVTVAQDVSASPQAYLRLLQLASDVKAVSLTLENGTTVLTNLAPFSVSDYTPYDVNRSTLVTLTISPVTAPSFVKGWSIPPLAPGYYTGAIIGNNTDNTLDLIIINEDSLCEGKLLSSACIILVNNIKGSPPLTLTVENAVVIGNAPYRHIVAGSVPAGSYLNLTAVDATKPETVVLQLQRGFFEPNTIYLYSLYGNYPGQMFSDYNIGMIRRVPVDTMTFLQGIKADPQLTDGITLFSMENIVAILEQSGYNTLLSNPALSVTVFAPTDAAVLNAVPDLYQCITTNPMAMKALILNHIVVGSYSPTQLVNAGEIATMSGTSHSFTADGSDFLIDNTVRVTNSRYYPTLNGSLYLTDGVLVPDGFAQQYCGTG